MTPTKFDEAQVREAAYALWIEEGQPQGRDQDHWLMAIDALSAAPAKAKPARKAAAKPRAAAKAKTAAAAKPRAAARSKPAAGKAKATAKAATK